MRIVLPASPKSTPEGTRQSMRLSAFLHAVITLFMLVAIPNTIFDSSAGGRGGGQGVSGILAYSVALGTAVPSSSQSTAYYQSQAQ